MDRKLTRTEELEKLIKEQELDAKTTNSVPKSSIRTKWLRKRRVSDDNRYMKRRNVP